MFAKIRAHWSKISTGLLLATLLGLGGLHLYDRTAGDCCKPNAACCVPGASCCHGRSVAQR
jgi:hypothetical protein